MSIYTIPGSANATISSQTATSPWFFAPTSASGTAYAGTPTLLDGTPISNTLLTTPANGQMMIFVPDVNNTGAVTFQIDGTNARSARWANSGGSTLVFVSGDLITPQPYLFVWRVGLLRWVLVNPTPLSISGSTLTSSNVGAFAQTWRVADALSLVTSLTSPQVITPIVNPSADSTTALQITKADGTTRVVDIDTTNARVGINKTPGAFDLDVNGAVNFGASAAITAGNLTAGLASTTAVGSGLNTVETAVVSATIPASFVAAGTTFKIKAYGTCTSSAANSNSWKVRWGVNGTSGDTQIGIFTTTAQTSGTNIPFYVEFLVNFTSTTATEVTGFFLNNGTTGATSTQTPLLATPTATSALTTNTQQKLTLLYVSAVNTTTSTFQVAAIEVMKQ